MKKVRLLLYIGILFAVLSLVSSASNEPDPTDVIIEDGSSQFVSGCLGDLFCISQNVIAEENKPIRSIEISTGPGISTENRARVFLNEHELSSSYYTVTTTQCLNNGKLIIHFSENTWTGFGEPFHLTVYYRIRLNETATVGENKNRLHCTLKTADETRLAGTLYVNTYSLTISRGYQSADGGVRPVEGAGYAVYRQGSDEKLSFTPCGTGIFRYCRSMDCTHKRHLTALRTEVNGAIRLEGLASGKYTLIEERAGKGITPYAEPLNISVLSTGETVLNGRICEDDTVSILTRNTGMEAGQSIADHSFYRRGIPFMITVDLLALLTHKRRIRTIG